jgi:hypothetical protein
MRLHVGRSDEGDPADDLTRGRPHLTFFPYWSMEWLDLMMSVTTGAYSEKFCFGRDEAQRCPYA